MKNNINIYSEIGTLKEVLVHTPGNEIRRVSPERLEELLFSAVLEPDEAIKEHKSFCKILEDLGVKVIQLSDLTAETYDLLDDKIKDQFIEEWLDQSEPKLNKELREKVKKFILSSKNSREMIRKMMSGVLAEEIGIKQDKALVVDPMPNLYFTRDPFASIGNGISLNSMKYSTRRREVIFSKLIFSYHPKYKNTPRFFDSSDLSKSQGTIEGGDIFIYNEKTLVIGNSERTNHEAILSIGKNIKKDPECKFEKIIAINVPPMPNLMHLDTWLTMLDHNKFLYSPNMLSVLKFWELDLTKSDLKMIEKNSSLKDMLKSIIGEEPILIPIAGKEANEIDINIETHFDGTNYLVITPGVVVGYDRNAKTSQALKDAGIKVLAFEGNQLSLGMGSARCMSMPLYRENLKK